MTQTQNVIVRDPEVLNGAPVFRGTQVPVHSLIEQLAAGDTLYEFLDSFPTVTKEAAIRALEETKSLLTAAVL